MLVPFGAATDAFEETAQLLAVTAVLPLSVTPVPLPFRAMMHAQPLGFSSAKAVEVTEI